MNEKLKEQLQKKSLPEIEAMIAGLKRKMAEEKNLSALHQINTDLSVMQEIRDHKLRESGRIARPGVKSAEKPSLKSFDDYVKSKK